MIRRLKPASSVTLAFILVTAVGTAQERGLFLPAVQPALYEQSHPPVPRIGFESTLPYSTQTPHSPALFNDDLSPSGTSPSVIGASLTGQPLPAVEFDPQASATGRVGGFSDESDRFDIGVDFYSPPPFEGGLIIVGPDVSMKVSGYVKADFIYDFDPIDSTDSFVTTDIPVGAPRRTNARFHARQSRLGFDTRWNSGGETIRIYLEGDFFSDGDRFRLRHAYGEVGSLLVGKTWTTFTDVSAAPATLDFEGSVSSVNRRQAQARWTRPVFHDGLELAVAVEDTRFIVETPPGFMAETRSPSPDFVVRLRLNKDWGQFQFANLYRIGGLQPADGDMRTGTAWGFNFTGVVMLNESSEAYYQILFGEGIGSYRSLPDAAPESPTSLEVLGLFGWMVGITHDWNDRLSSNFTYAENSLDNTAFQAPDDVHRTTYLAANLIWSPLDRVKVGVEYLYGIRVNVDRSAGSANRVQAAFIFDLP